MSWHGIHVLWSNPSACGGNLSVCFRADPSRSHWSGGANSPQLFKNSVSTRKTQLHGLKQHIQFRCSCGSAVPYVAAWSQGSRSSIASGPPAVKNLSMWGLSQKREMNWYTYIYIHIYMAMSWQFWSSFRWFGGCEDETHERIVSLFRSWWGWFLIHLEPNRATDNPNQWKKWRTTANSAEKLVKKRSQHSGFQEPSRDLKDKVDIWHLFNSLRFSIFSMAARNCPVSLFLPQICYQSRHHFLFVDKAEDFEARGLAIL